MRWERSLAGEWFGWWVSSVLEAVATEFPGGTTLDFRFTDDSEPEFVFSRVFCEPWRETWRLLAAAPKLGTMPESIVCYGIVLRLVSSFPP